MLLVAAQRSHLHQPLSIELEGGQPVPAAFPFHQPGDYGEEYTMDNKQFAVLAHSAAEVLKGTSNRKAPFRWTEEEWATLVKYGQAMGIPGDVIESTLHNASTDEAFHQQFIDELHFEDLLTAYLAAEPSEQVESPEYPDLSGDSLEDEEVEEEDNDTVLRRA